MIYTYPDYYDKFECLMGKCPQSCCKGWIIDIEDELLEKYLKCDTCFASRLKNEVDFEEGVYHLYNGRCAFLNDDDLCDIHIEAGRGMMAKTCKDYPMHVEEFENERSISYIMSCPTIAKLVLENKNKLTFVEKEDDTYEEDEDFDFLLYEALKDSRKRIIEIIQDRDVDIYQRIQAVCIMTEQIQECIVDNNIFEIYNINTDFDINSTYKDKKLVNSKKFITRAISILKDLIILEKNWGIDLDRWEKIAGECSKEDYDINPTTQIELEQVMVYYIYMYFLGAVYDGDVLSKVLYSTFGTFLFDGLCRIECIEKNKTSIDDKLKQSLAFRYSREIEHEDDNVDGLELYVYENRDMFFIEK